jgi:hypothetical protein
VHLCENWLQNGNNFLEYEAEIFTMEVKNIHTENMTQQTGWEEHAVFNC